MSNAPLRVAITGAAGNIGYSLVFRIASGAMFGPNQPVILHLIEIEPALPALGGVVMELEDCAFPLLKGVVPTANLDEGFRGANWALLVGSVPRKAGMERKDLLGINGKIFTGQGQAIARNAASDVRVLVIGNPCNTNCLIAMNNAPEVPRDRWFAMTRLDENRAKTQLAQKAKADISQVSNLAIWGNHSSTMYPDFYNAKIGGQPATSVITDAGWFAEKFIPTVQQRANLRLELAELHGLGQIDVGADLQADDPVDQVAPGRAHDDVGAARPAQALGDLESALTGEIDVENDQFDGVGRHHVVQLGAAAGRMDVEAAARQVLDHVGKQGLIVLDDSDDDVGRHMASGRCSTIRSNSGFSPSASYGVKATIVT